MEMCPLGVNVISANCDGCSSVSSTHPLPFSLYGSNTFSIGVLTVGTHSHHLCLSGLYIKYC